MRKRAIVVVAVFTALLGAAVARGEISQEGNVRITFNAGFAPTTLPRQKLVPVTVKIEGEIGTTDGTHPPAVKRIEIDLNRHGRISTAGLPTCKAATLQSTTTQAALERCGPALVGRGRFGASVDFPTQTPIPARGTILAFNGTRGKHPAVLLQLFGTTPVQATFVLPLAIEHQKKGQFGTVLAANIPTLAGGVGSVTEIELRIRRDYTYKGQRRSFLSASCPAPAGFPGAPFPFARGRFSFVDGKQITTSLTRNCHVG
jgi:hypothetical protein